MDGQFGPSFRKFCPLPVPFDGVITCLRHVMFPFGCECLLPTEGGLGLFAAARMGGAWGDGPGRPFRLLSPPSQLSNNSHYVIRSTWRLISDRNPTGIECSKN